LVALYLIIIIIIIIIIINDGTVNNLFETISRLLNNVSTAERIQPQMIINGE
jgi:hypothetical protein